LPIQYRKSWEREKREGLRRGKKESRIGPIPSLSFIPNVKEEKREKRGERGNKGSLPLLGKKKGDFQ